MRDQARFAYPSQGISCLNHVPQFPASSFGFSPRFTFKRPPFLRAGSILQTWSRRGYLTPDFGGLDAQEGIDQFFHGKTLFQLVSSLESSQIGQDERETGLPVGVFAFPTNRGLPVMPQSGYLG